MKIKEIHLVGHKRFTSLKILNLPIQARLVVLIGPHGCGKSSLLEALNIQDQLLTGHGWSDSGGDYYSKNRFHIDRSVESGQQAAHNYNVNEAVRILWHTPPSQNEQNRAIYVRTAYRNDPVLAINRISAAAPMTQERRFSRMIENDAAVTGNFQRLVSQALERATATEPGTSSLDEYRQRLLGPLQESMSRLFSNPKLILDNLGNPLEGRNFTFTKGTSGGFPYMNLSAGEKTAFDLLLDIYVKKSVFDNTVYCIDEPEVHMGIQLQGDLLEEMLHILPGESQLWIATHSIGMMRRAFDMHQKAPGEVVFLNFAGEDPEKPINFDNPIEIEPSRPNRWLWKNIHGVALENLAELTAPDRIVICEGDPKGEFDAECYRKIFAEEFPDTEFISAGSHSSVRGNALPAVILKIASGVQVIRVIDNDGQHDDDAAESRDRGVYVLNRRCLEHYLLDEEVMRNFFTELEGKDKGEEIMEALTKEMGDSLQHMSSDEIKGAANHLCKMARQLLSDPAKQPKLGKNGNSFMRHALAHYVRGTKAYEELREVIFGKPNSE